MLLCTFRTVLYSTYSITYSKSLYFCFLSQIYKLNINTSVIAGDCSWSCWWILRRWLRDKFDLHDDTSKASLLVFPSCSELHQMGVGSVGVELQHLSVSIRAVFHRHLSCAPGWRSSSSRQLLLAQRNEGGVEPQAVLLADVVVVLHGPAFGLPAQRGLRDDQQAAGKLQHRDQLPRVGLAQPQVQQCGRWKRETRTQCLHLTLRDLQ